MSALVVLVYLPVWNCAYVWDDDLHLLNNLVLKPGGLWRTWFSTDQFMYYPITWTSYWLEHQLWGFHPRGYHLVNVLLHAVNTCLVWRVLQRLRVPGAFVAALLFGVHPVNVESVAWITQRKNLLSMLFFLIALDQWLRGDRQCRWRPIAGATAAFLAAMLSKGAAVILAPAALLLSWHVWGRLRGRSLRYGVPLLVVAGLMSISETWFSTHNVVAGDIVRQDSPLARIAGIGWITWFYWIKACWPVELCFVYPRWVIDPARWWTHVPNALLAGALLGAWAWRQRLGRGWFTALAYFAGAVFPAAGFVHFYYLRYSFVADHYQYLALPAVPALLVGLLMNATRRRGRAAVTLVVAALLALAAVLASMTWRQIGSYRNVLVLYEQTLCCNPNAWLAQNNLATLHQTWGQPEQALPLLHQALEQRRSDLAVHASDGRPPLTSEVIGMMLNYANALQAAQRRPASEHLYRRILAQVPAHATANRNLGALLLDTSRAAEALPRLSRAVELAPDDEAARGLLAQALLAQGQPAAAAEQLAQAVLLNPEDAALRLRWGQALAQAGQLPRAAQVLQQARELQPEDPALLDALIVVQLQMGQTSAALPLLEQLAAHPQASPVSRRRLVWVLATAPNTALADAQRAVALGEQLCAGQATPDALTLDALAAAYARVGRYDQAVRLAHAAELQALQHQQTTLAQDIARRAARYAAGQPWVTGNSASP